MKTLAKIINVSFFETYTQMFRAVLFTVARGWKQPKCRSTDEEINKCGTAIRWNITWQ